MYHVIHHLRVVYTADEAHGLDMFYVADEEHERMVDNELDKVDAIRVQLGMKQPSTAPNLQSTPLVIIRHEQVGAV